MSLIDRIGGLAGIGAAIYLMFLPGCVCDLWLEETGPGIEIAPETPSAEIARTFAANGEAGRVSAYIGLIAIVLLVIFFSRLHAVLRDVSGPTAWLPTATLAGGLLLAGVLLFEIGLIFAATELESYGGETQVLRFFPLWGWNSASLLSPPFALALFGTTLVATSTGAFPKWYRAACIGLFLLLVVIAGVIRAPGLAVAPGMLWLMLTSLVLATRSPVAVPQPAPSV